MPAFSLQLFIWELNLQFPGVFQKEFERSSACLQVFQSHQSGRNQTAATLKGKPTRQKQKRGRCYKQTWAKGSLWFSNKKVIRGVRALEYPSRYFHWDLHLGEAGDSAAKVCRIYVSSSFQRSLLTSRAPTWRQAKAAPREGNWCHQACVKRNLKNSSSNREGWLLQHPGKGTEPEVACPDAFRPAMELPQFHLPGWGFLAHNAMGLQAGRRNA